MVRWNSCAINWCVRGNLARSLGNENFKIPALFIIIITITITALKNALLIYMLNLHVFWCLDTVLLFSAFESNVCNKLTHVFVWDLLIVRPPVISLIHFHTNLRSGVSHRGGSCVSGRLHSDASSNIQKKVHHKVTDNYNL